MSKLAIQFITSILIIVVLVIALGQISFVDEERVEKLTEETQKKLGNLLLDNIRHQHRPFDNDTLHAVIHDLYITISDSNGVDTTKISLHIINNNDINAYVIPGNHIILLTGLIDYTETPEELAGVLAHEIAHIQENHITSRMVKLFGLNMLTMISGLDSSAYLVSELLRTLAATAFTREQEREADQKAVEYLHNAGIDPAHLAGFLLRLSSEMEHNTNTLPQWLRTHPDSKNRAEMIMTMSSELEGRYSPAYSGDWKSLIRDR